ncbi:hypothetical protein [Arcanobacterium buesumense]|uniref:Uncharacterized protein n=1 Tax=Arcanobacterium buesumense TaxID=2722751 RepID=A0A6H2EN53_9ACTO|nr:hypothetical protein [Arcanobacterium buesumense]QJC22494.1 hypothetical protein HC352_08265 [Arcanobacterium buesumense]
MNIISEGGDENNKVPYAVGTPNATEDVYHHIKPGRKRANFFRYFRFNLPRLTKALLIAVIATTGGAAAYVAVSGHEPFPHGMIPLWIVTGLAMVFVLVALTTRLPIWDYGSLISFAACVTYIGGIVSGSAPFVWNGASIPLAASWNLMIFASLGYFVLNWAVNFGILVVWPKTQGFTD